LGQWRPLGLWHQLGQALLKLRLWLLLGLSLQLDLLGQ
jgi:hypothetical protein